jgi:hypothetical protein
MNADEILYYTDGHQVMVTNSFFKVRKTQYQLKGITKHELYIVHPPKIFQFALLVAGAVAFMTGAMSWYPASMAELLKSNGINMDMHMFLMSLGLVLFAAGMVVLWVLKEKYAVRIRTAEGEKDVVVSENREYANMIVEALNRAYLNLTNAPERKHTPKYFVSPK